MEPSVVHAMGVTLLNTKMDFVLNVSKMLNVRINKCTSCQNVMELLSEIDGRIFYYGCNQYRNDSLLLNQEVKKDVVKKLIKYKQIMIKRLYNPNYVCDVTLGQIIAQIKIYLYR